MNSRKRRLVLNTWSALLCQIVTILCGFIIPRVILAAFGSKVNGTITSINQFLGVISFMQLGVGAVVQSALYKPLAQNDMNTVSKIFVSAQNFFRKIALIFSVYVVVLFVIYPTVINKEYNFGYTASLVFILSISLFVQYYFGLTSQLLLIADQKAYITLFCDILTISINALFTVVLVNMGMSIQVVKLVSAAVFLLRPIFLNTYVRKNYHINSKIQIDKEPIEQKWNGFAQHLSSTVMDNTDVIILSIFSTLENVSIYNVYNLVVFGVRQVIVSLTTGVQSLFGNLIASEKREYVLDKFNVAEFVFHLIVSILFSIVCVMIVPFIFLYTKGITDADYLVPLFALIISLAQAAYCYRLVYYVIIKSAGHYKQTQKSAFAEMFINLGVSIIGVLFFGLIGVAIGTLVANIYRTIYFVLYLRKNILYINLKKTCLRFIADVFSILLVILLFKLIPLSYSNYVEWILSALLVTTFSIVISTIINIAINGIFIRGLNKNLIQLLLNKRRNKNV